MADDLAIIFAYHFPPENAIGAQRPYRLYKYLSRLGFRCHVISAAQLEERPDIDGQHVPDPFVTKPRQGVGWQVERAIRRFILPGVVGSQWAIGAYRAARRFIRQNPGHRVTVISTVPPVGPHLAAYWLARQEHIPWIADYRDPLGDNPFYDHINSFTKDVYRKLERICVLAADVTIANTDAVQAKMKKIYPDRADRIELIWNGFDPEDRLTALPPEGTGRNVIAHVGELYGGRSVSPLLESLRRLIDSRIVDPRSFQISLTGPVVEGSIPDSVFMRAAEQEGWVKFNPDRVPQSTAHRIIQTADAHLLIQPQTALQVPGKLFDYLQIGRPVLAFVPPDSPVERILEKSGVPFRCVYPPCDQDNLDPAMLEFLRLLPAQGQPSEWFEQQFNARGHAETVANLIERAHEKRRSAVGRVPVPRGLNEEPR